MPNPSQPARKTDKDAELVRAINGGRHELFHELVRRYEKTLYNFGLRMCDNPSDAEDMVQDTFLNVFKYLNGFRYETKFKNWVYRMSTLTAASAAASVINPVVFLPMQPPCQHSNKLHRQHGPLQLCKQKNK